MAAHWCDCGSRMKELRHFLDLKTLRNNGYQVKTWRTAPEKLDRLGPAIVGSNPAAGKLDRQQTTTEAEDRSSCQDAFPEDCMDQEDVPWFPTWNITSYVIVRCCTGFESIKLP